MLPKVFNICELLKGSDMSIDAYLEVTDGGTLEKAEAERWKATAPPFKTLMEAFLYASRRLYPISRVILRAS